MSIEVKQPSEGLLSLLKQCSESLINFTETWLKVKAKGQGEDFTEKELQDMMRPFLRSLGKNKDQIYYWFHREEQIEKVKENNRKFTAEEYEQLRITIAEKEEETRSLKLNLEDVLQKKKINSEDINQLERLDEKSRHLKQDLIGWHKSYVEWSQKKAIIVSVWANDLEIKCTILHKPLNTICVDIFDTLKSMGLADGAETVVYDNLPRKYKNLTKQEFISRAHS